MAKDNTDEPDNKRTNTTANEAVTQDYQNSIQLANTKVRLRKNVDKSGKTKAALDNYTTKTTDIGNEELGGGRGWQKAQEYDSN